jgi:aminoglycoside phosphotransferase (APT) family kinase protein
MADASKAKTPAATPELIDIREGEDFDHAKLAGWLQDQGLPGAEGPLRVRQFGGGHANLTYRLLFGEGDSEVEYVLRRPPLGPVAASSHDMNREYRALSKLWRGFPLAPRAFLYCEDASIVGAHFLIMERRHGVVVRNVVPEVFGGGRDPVANRKLSTAVIDTLSDFHAVSPAEVELEGLGKPEGFLERQVRGWIGRYEKAKVDDIAIAEEVARWLIEALPTSPEPTLVHNDWKLDNMAVAEDDPGHCVAVYDWDMCTVGDPLCDVGTLFATWGDPGEAGAGASPMPTASVGFMRRSEAVERYAERSGTDLSAIPYYNVFGCYKMAVVLQQIYVRYHRGQTKDERFAGMGAGAVTLFEAAADRRP